MRKENILAAAMLAASLVVTPALAAPVIVEYKAVISTMVVYGSTTEQVESNDYAGFNISRGETVTGYFSYDTTTQLNWEWTPWSGSYYSLDGQVQQSLKFQNGSSGLQFDLDSHLVAADYPSYFGIWTYAYGENTRLYTDFRHLLPYALPGEYLPEVKDWTEFGAGSYFEFLHESPDGNSSVSLRADITSIRAVTPVPEPSTYMMLGAGMGLMALARRGRRTPLAAQT